MRATATRNEHLTKGRYDTRLCGGHTHADHVFLGRQHGMVPHGAQVTPVIHRDDT
jgi:hypothetical protein